MKTTFFENLIEQKLLQLHTCYLARVSRVNGNNATIQPLSMIKAVGGKPKKQAVIENVPISRTVSASLETYETLQGKVVIVICCERDISQVKKGIFALPSIRRHSLSDSVIIGFL
jgi:hypothetical protein